MPGSGFLGRGMGPSPIARRRAAAADWWYVPGKTCRAAYKAIGAADLAVSYINLPTPGTNNAAPGVAPTLGAAGWVLDGTQWLDTGYVPTKQIFSALVRFSDFVGGNYLLGCGGVGYEVYIQPNNSGNSYFASGGALGGLPPRSSGVLAIAGNIAYFNGVAESGFIADAANAITRSLHIGDENTSYGASPYYAIVATIAAVAIYSDTLSAAEVEEKTAAMAALA